MSENIQIQQGISAIRNRLQNVRVHYKNVTIFEWISIALAAFLPVLALLCILDNLFHLPMGVRLVALIGLGTGMFYIIRKAVETLRVGSTDEELALRVEEAFPDLNNELINSLLLSKEAGDEATHLVSEVVQNGSHDSATVDLTQAVSKKRLKIFGGAAGAAFVVLGIYAALSGAYFTNAFVRVLVPILPVEPLTLTKIDVTPKSCNILSGESVKIAATLSGRPAQAEIGYKIGNGELKIARMFAMKDDDMNYEYVLRQVTQNATYYVKAGDADTEEYRVTVHDRPVLKDIKVSLTYPEYAGQKPTVQNKLNVAAITGTAVDITATTNKAIDKATIQFNGQEPVPMDITNGTTVHTRYVLDTKLIGGAASLATYQIHLKDTFGFKNQPLTYQAEALEDRAPTIDIIEPTETVMVAEDGTLAFDFTAADDYGVRSVSMIQYDADNKTSKTINTWEPEGKFTKEFNQRYELPVADLGIEPGKTTVVYLTALDGNNITGPGEGSSSQIKINIASNEAVAQKEEEKKKEAAETLADIIKLQTANLRSSKVLRDAGEPEDGVSVAKDPLKSLVDNQEAVRLKTQKVIATLKMDNPVRGTLETLYAMDMITAIKQLRAVQENFSTIEDAVKTESDILSKLTARSESLADANRKQMEDIFAELDEIIAEQKDIEKQTQAHADGAEWKAPKVAAQQDQLSNRTARFKGKLMEHAAAVGRSDSEFGAKIKGAADSIETLEVRQDMIRNAAHIEDEKTSESLVVEARIIKNLLAIKKMLRDGVAQVAEDRLNKLKRTIVKSRHKTDKLLELSKQIKQISDELEAAKDQTEDDNEELKKKLAQIKDLEDKMSEVVEKMAKDLHLFPDVPAANELVQKMREVYEDVIQAAGSDKAEAGDIAVTRGDTKGQKLPTDAFKEMKERMADMEMWLGSAPDATKWKTESKDKEEIPEIPVVDLPEEFEDLVGDLLEQEQEIDDESQDSASNMGTNDMPAGWGVADGNMPNYSAKGKSGNTRPNAMEQSGRSTGGREGMANGEMVGGVAKDLEGRETEVRRTNDSFQKGQIAEENPDPSKARATGGGKQSGSADGTGFTGSAPPRNELGQRALKRKKMDLRRRAEQLYSKAVLLYLPTGELDKAILLMQQQEEALDRGDMEGFKSLQSLVVKTLDNTHREITGKSRVEIDPLLRMPSEMQEEIRDSRDEEIPDKYKPLVSEYYKAIAGALEE